MLINMGVFLLRWREQHHAAGDRARANARAHGVPVVSPSVAAFADRAEAAGARHPGEGVAGAPSPGAARRPLPLCGRGEGARCAMDGGGRERPAALAPCCAAHPIVEY